MKFKTGAIFAWLAIVPLAASHAGIPTRNKFCEDIQYVVYDPEHEPSKTAKYYVIKLPQSSYVDMSDFGATIGALGSIDAKSYFSRLSMDGPPTLECSASGIGDGNFDDFENFTCRNLGASSAYDPTIGTGLAFDENDNATERDCGSTAHGCFIVRDKGGSRYFTMADSLLHPLLRGMTSVYYEIDTDGTTDGVARVYSKQFAFSRGGYSYFLIGYEEQGGLKCTFERAPEPQF